MTTHMTVIEKVKYLINQFEKTNERIYAVDVLHLLDKYLDTGIFNTAEGHKKTIYHIKCKDCGKEIIGKTTRKEICSKCANIRKVKAHKERKLNEANRNHTGPR